MYMLLLICDNADKYVYLSNTLLRFISIFIIKVLVTSTLLQ